MQIDQCLETLQELLTKRRWSLKNNTIGVIPNSLIVEDINIDIDTLQNAIHLIACEIDNRNDNMETLLEDSLKDHFKKCELAVLHFSAKDLVDLSGELYMMLDDIKNIVQKKWRMPISTKVDFYDLWAFVNKKRHAVHPRPKTRTYQFFASQFFSVPELISFLDADNLLELEKKQRKPSWFESFKYDDFLQAMTKEKPTENSMAQKMILLLEMLTKRKKTSETILKYLISSSESFEQFIGKFQALFEAKKKEL